VISIFTVLVSHNRPDLLWRTVKSYTQTKDAGCQLIIVDNDSSAETVKLLEEIDRLALAQVFHMESNRYPGAATNEGWSWADSATQFLHRSDNDIEYLPGWPERVRMAFWAHPEWGQLSMRTDEEELFQDAVGGNNVIRRAVWDAGVRYTEEPWSRVPWEDGDFNQRVRRAGFGWGRVTAPCIVHIGDKMLPEVNLDDPYYDRTYAERGISSLLRDARDEKRLVG
jgi:glycosyltransferase involved in cell wall biosynthesis